MKTLNYIAITATAIFTLSSCSDDDSKNVNTPVNEEEVITTIITTLTHDNQIITLTSRDLDGPDGPDAPVVTVSGNLAANTTYVGSVKFLNEIANPAEDITEEIHEESDEHQIFYQAPAALGTFTYTDLDINGKPVGLNFKLVTANATTGSLIVTLIHEPNKNAEGVANGNITNAAGSTDAQGSYLQVIVE